MNKVARLAVDSSHWYKLWMVVYGVMLIGLDQLWSTDHEITVGAIILSIVLTSISTMTALRLPLWRILPVTKRHINLARWWQAVAGPAVMLLILQLLVAVVRKLIGAPYDLGFILLLTLAQAAMNAIYTAAFFVLHPWLARQWGRPDILATAFSMLPIIAMPILLQLHIMPDGVTQGWLISIVLAGLAVAAGLYAFAGRWPEAIANVTSGSTKMARRDTRRVTGWAALILAFLPSLASICITLVIGTAIFSLLQSGHSKTAVHTFGFSFVGGSVPITVMRWAVAMRPLRALPLTGNALVLRLAFTSLSIFGIFTTIMVGMSLELDPQTSISFTLTRLTPMIGLNLLALAAMLRFGPKNTMYGYLLLGMPIAMLLGKAVILTHFFQTWFPAVVTLVLSALGLWWMRWEITRGSHAWRVQPLQPQRFRGY